ncbi:GNAT family N-acetyltransferase [Bifidobacterium sp. ESL0745]|uniref:GNAT family N-acetyltransferase n=1 Tax=Bifidobacterium sp. ESL0745 TaxID=2983226 RepID=UPI0023F771CC|nr:GNAT family N-acetyltransferase [Bifidobacterium sp. ESL0745]MDF7664740.1 GNAT family N-acetyltransferase [Bifidobacterium sp. ESL0745]
MVYHHIVVRHITPADFEAKAQVHSQTWHETYQGKLPQWLVDKITPEFALEVTKRHDPANVFVVLMDGEVVGYAELVNPAREPSNYPNTAELAAIYVLNRCQGLGIGRKLAQTVFDALPTKRVVLWVLEYNEKAQGFYRHIGFHPTGKTQTEDNGANPEIEFANFDTTA